MQASDIYFAICQFGLLYLSSATTFGGFENDSTCVKIEKNTTVETLTVKKNLRLVVLWEQKGKYWESTIGKSFTEKIYANEGEVDTLEFCFINTSRDDSGTYMWRDNHNYNQNITINVWYGPKQLTVSPNVRKLVFLERNQTLSINCSAECNPDCIIIWRKDSNMNITSTASLVLNNVSKNDNGYYTCLAKNPRNKTYSLSKNIRILVNYTSKINLTPHRIKEVEENANVNITCSVEKYTMSNISWLRGDKEVDTIYRVENDVVLILYNTTCNDTGTYTCSALNDIGAEDKKDIKIDVLCKPRFLGNTFGNTIKKKTEACIGDEIRMNISMQANPSPHVMSENYDIDVKILNISDIFYHVFVRKKILSELDFQQQYFIIGNNLGNVTIIIDVKERKGNFANNIEFIIGTPMSVLLLIGVVVIIITLVKRLKKIKGNQTPRRLQRQYFVPVNC